MEKISTNNNHGYVHGINYQTGVVNRTVVSAVAKPYSDSNLSFNTGNFFILKGTTAFAQPTNIITYLDNLDFSSMIPNQVVLALVLRRDDKDFALIHESFAVDRLDISNTNPLITMGVGLGDTWIIPNSPMAPNLSGIVIPTFSNGLPLDLINDFRALETTGMDFDIMNKSLVYSTSSGIFTRAIDAIPGWNYLPTITGYMSNYYHISDTVINLDPSGIMTGDIGQIETTNVRYPSQYVFAAVSGLFYQMSPDGAWSERSVGLPSISGLEITRIRVDGRI
jgi:hypothetical protein